MIEYAQRKEYIKKNLDQYNQLNTEDSDEEGRKRRWGKRKEKKDQLERVAAFLGSGEQHQPKEYEEPPPPDPECIFGPLKTPYNDRMNVPKNVARSIIAHGALTHYQRSSTTSNTLNINMKTLGFGLSRDTSNDDMVASIAQNFLSVTNKKKFLSPLTDVENQFLGLTNEIVLHGEENNLFGKGPSKDEMLREGNKLLAMKMDAT